MNSTDPEPPCGPLHHTMVAFQFLTRIPMPRDLSPSPNDLARAAGWFPVVGAVVGAMIALAAWAAMGVGLAPGVAAVIAVAVGILVTGSFHEDGLADSADAFGGGWSREQVLAIMRDSRIGSYGAASLVMLVAARLAALWSMDIGAWAAVLICAHSIARWSSLWLLRTNSYARDRDESPGLGKPMVESLTGATFAFGTVAAVIIGVASLGFLGFVAIAVAACVASLWARYCHARIGGLTGDALGAANVLVEVAILIGCAARFPATVSPWILP